jgi:hypothetical protein
MTKFMINIPVIKDICEVIGDSLVIVFFFNITNWTQNLGKFYFLIIINLLYKIYNKMYFISFLKNFIIFHPINCWHMSPLKLNLKPNSSG